MTKLESKYLVTTDSWFYAPDGRTYRAVWGDLEILPDSVLGVKTNKNSSNWYAKVGSEKNHVVIAGCQVHYAVSCPKKPYTKNGMTWEDKAKNKKELKEIKMPSVIYIAE